MMVWWRGCGGYKVVAGDVVDTGVVAGDVVNDRVVAGDVVDDGMENNIR